MRFTQIAAAGLAVAVAFGLSGSATSDFSDNYVSCSFAKKKRVLRVLVKDETGVIRRKGRRILVLGPGARGLDLIECAGAGQAKIRNTDRIRFDIRSVGDTDGRLVQAGGRFEPGRTREVDGTSEIEIVTSIRDIGDTATIGGTDRGEHLRGGRLARGKGINLNVASEAVSPDVDLRFTRTGKASVWFSPGRGGDIIDMGGGPEFEGAFRARGGVIGTLGKGADTFIVPSSPTAVWGAGGSDSITTGSGMDYVLAGGGDDTVATGAKEDFVVALAGRDIADSGAGDDSVVSRDREVDVIDCGDGVDEYDADDIDVTVGCERVVRF